MQQAHTISDTACAHSLVAAEAQHLLRVHKHTRSTHTQSQAHTANVHTRSLVTHPHPPTECAPQQHRQRRAADTNRKRSNGTNLQQLQVWRRGSGERTHGCQGAQARMASALCARNLAEHEQATPPTLTPHSSQWGPPKRNENMPGTAGWATSARPGTQPACLRLTSKGRLPCSSAATQATRTSREQRSLPCRQCCQGCLFFEHSSSDPTLHRPQASRACAVLLHFCPSCSLSYKI